MGSARDAPRLLLALALLLPAAASGDDHWVVLRLPAPTSLELSQVVEPSVSHDELVEGANIYAEMELANLPGFGPVATSITFVGAGSIYFPGFCFDNQDCPDFACEAPTPYGPLPARLDVVDWVGDFVPVQQPLPLTPTGVSASELDLSGVRFRIGGGYTHCCQGSFCGVGSWTVFHGPDPLYFPLAGVASFRVEPHPDPGTSTVVVTVPIDSIGEGLVEPPFALRGELVFVTEVPFAYQPLPVAPLAAPLAALALLATGQHLLARRRRFLAR